MKNDTNKKTGNSIKFISILAIIFAVILATTMFFYLQDSPQQVAQKYFDALQKNNFNNAYEYICKEDKNELSYDDFIKKYHFDEPQRKMFVQKSKYEVSKTEINKNIAKVFVKITSPDVAQMVYSMMPMIMSKALSNDNNDDKEIQNKLSQKLEDDNIPTVTTEETINVIKDDGKWKVYLNIRQNNQIEKLKNEANEYKKEKKLRKAKEKYEEILQLNGNSVEAVDEIKKLDEEIDVFEEKQAYIKNITLKDVKVFDYKEYSWDDVEKAFKGVIVNDGDKTLKEVEITVYMYDKDDNIIAEEKFYPVAFGFGENKPFKPKFVKDFGWKLTKYAPTGWSGKIKVEVTDIEFQ